VFVVTVARCSFIFHSCTDHKCLLHPRESNPGVVQSLGGVTAAPTLLGPILVWSQQNRGGASGCQGGHCPQNFALPPQWPPKIRSLSVGLFLKVLHRPLTAPFVAKLAHRVAPQMKMSGSALAAELSEIAVDREVFQVLLCILSPQPSLEEKRGEMNEINRIYISLFTHV